MPHCHDVLAAPLVGPPSTKLIVVVAIGINFRGWKFL